MTQPQMTPVLIEVQLTPNPQVRKFMPGRAVTGTAETIELADFAKARRVSDLAAALFELPETKRVFLGKDFVSVMIHQGVSWEEFTPVLMSVLNAYFSENKPVLHPGQGRNESDSEMEVRPEDAEIVRQIKTLIETRVRPAVAADGGDIVFRGYEDGVVFLGLRGACAGCPSAQATLKDGVERLLKHFIPQVKEVRQAA